MTSIGGRRLSIDLQRRSDITVETIAARDGIQTYRRRWGMVVAVYDDPAKGNNGFYYLKKGKNSHILGDNNNWEAWEDHPRLHDIDSPTDHAPAAEADKGKFVRANPTTGAIELYDPALGEQHDRQHSITSEDDHATEIDHAGNVAGWDAEGKPAAKKLKYKQETAPDPTTVHPDSVWIKDTDTELKVFEIINASGTQFWAEVTSPKILT